MNEAPPQRDDLLAYVRAAARVLRMPLPQENEGAVLDHFARLAAFAHVVAEHPFGITDEPATSFVPGARE